MADDTIFHKIIRREIPADIVYEDEHLIAFRDIAPQAPVHVLFVPKTVDRHAQRRAAVAGRDRRPPARSRPRTTRKQQGFAEDGYRVVMNCNGHGGQTVFQLHLHLLAGAPLGRFGTPSNRNRHTTTPGGPGVVARDQCVTTSPTTATAPDG